MIVNPIINIDEVTLENVVEKIKEFYKEDEWNFITVNGTDIKGELQIDWLFSKYNDKNIIQIFRTVVDFNQKIPSIVPIIPSAWLAEWELADMFDVDVENAAKGVFIAPDSIKAPLRADTKL